MWDTPSSSPTIVGSAVEKIVWSSDASSIAVIRPISTKRMWRRSGAASGCRSACRAAAALGERDIGVSLRGPWGGALISGVEVLDEAPEALEGLRNEEVEFRGSVGVDPAGANDVHHAEHHRHRDVRLF